ncbi:MAG: ABC transporter substrate-binding protein [Clostridiales bacterium]|nr:ABC transporter substrate-binding protein [Clostridiales bacterium]
MKKTISLFLAALLAVLAAACSAPENDAAGTGQDGSLEKITLALDWTPNTNHTGFYVAESKGYFEELGIEVEIIQPPEDGATALVASGSAQFGVDFQDTLVSAFTEGLPVTAVAALLQHNTSGIVSLKENNIQSPKDMQGYKYATWDLPIEQAIIQQCVEADGGDYSQVELIPTYVEDIVSGLQSSVDCVWSYYGWDYLLAVEKGLDANFFLFKDIDPVFDYYTPVLVANNTFLEENGALAEKFLEACCKGYEYAIAHPDEAAQILADADDALELEEIKASQAYLSTQYKAETDRWGYIDQERWDAFYTWLLDNDLADASLGEGQWFTNDYLPE